MKISVTKEHISKGIKGNLNTCPVALAVQEATGKLWNVGFINFYGPNKLIIPIGPDVKNFIENFDSDKQVEPFQFEIAI